MSEKPREQTAIMHFRRKSSDRMSEKSQEQVTRTDIGQRANDGEDDTFVGRVPTGCQRSRENRLKQCSPAKTHEHELESKNCELSLVAKMSLLSEEFRQDV